MQGTALQYNWQHCWKQLNDHIQCEDYTRKRLLIYGNLAVFRLPYERYVIHGSASSNVDGFKQCSKRKLFTVLYFSILLHCIVQWLLQVIFPSVCSFIALVFTLSLHVSAYVAIFTHIRKEKQK
jgi:hypothetical protein